MTCLGLVCLLLALVGGLLLPVIRWVQGEEKKAVDRAIEKGWIIK